ncbi:MAG: SDR family oxidoreductase [Minicystis sp.]
MWSSTRPASPDQTRSIPRRRTILWHQIIDVNLHGTYHVCKHALPHLPDGRGRIINISSILGVKGVSDQTAYCTSKHAVIGLTRSLAHLAAPRRITVNALCPGWVRTEMAEERMREIGVTEADFKHTVPLGRFIEPGEVADLAIYLVSEAASGITGQALLIDGGTSA